MAIPLAVFSCTWNGIPLIYSGQELPNKKRLEFFERDPIEWTGKNALHDFYKTLLNLRTNNAALKAGKDSETIMIAIPTQPKLLSYLRKNGDKQVLVILNLGAVVVDFNISDKNLKGVYKNVFSNEAKEIQNTQLNIPAWGYLVFEK